MTIQENILAIQATLPENTTLVCVSKTQSKEKILEAFQAGVRHFGENRVQELVQKLDISDQIHWHLIGHLQRNKVKDVIGHVELIHSLDSIRLMDEANTQSYKKNLITHGLIQINVAEEKTKHGFHVEELDEVLKKAVNYPNLQIDGFMVIGPHVNDDQAIADVFKKSQALFQYYAQLYPQLKILSMGMSHDYQIALQYGANMVRIGSKIFQE